MSKSPNILLPALGVTGIVLGAAYGISQKGYGADKIASLETRVEQVETNASAAAANAAKATAQAEAEAARAAELQEQVAQVMAKAQEQRASAALTAPAPARDGGFGLGRAALPEEIAAWDVDVLPDGRGLPEGSGDVWTGEEVFVDYCAACHGDFAEGVDNWPVLAGGFDTLGDKDPVKTVGSYWPYLSTVFDYVHRSMPFGGAGTLTADETYAIVAYILYSNDMVDDDFVLSRDTFLDVEMHNADGFVVDDRPDLEYAEWRAEPCMEACKDEARITMRSVFLVETPPKGGSNSVPNMASVDGLPTFSADGPSFVPAAAPKPEVAAAPAPAPTETVASADDVLLKHGEKVFKKCAACHAVGDGARNKSGPQLNGLIGRAMGGVDGFKYSDGFIAAAAEGRSWTAEELAAFLAKPKAYMKGTKMAFAGLKKDEDIAAITAYLESFGE
ncbi:c-type cytochrome [uncultured Tateyamaria sp.]|uniref:c-type cytochrome n=1 Tax=Tateyamaria sp. 1078 TaxID=3417464 RepID=UPI0026301911|nr:c-type cytochrome [uncultured Tateyamaria sp.]